MNVAHFYHVWSDGHWQQPVAEHLDALDEAEFSGYFAVGIVGSNRNRAEVMREILGRRPINRVAIAREGFEQVTLTDLHRYAAKRDGAVMYAHTKGAHDNTEFRAAWRWSMTSQVVQRWRENIAELEAGHDAVGCHWLTETEFPGIVADTPFPMFGGNYWIASTEYLRQLPAPAGDRYAAEAWIGLGDPRVVDRTPGWPSLEAFQQSLTRTAA